MKMLNFLRSKMHPWWTKDGTHIRIQRPVHHEKACVTRKSVVMLNYKIVDACACWPGISHDPWIQRN